MELDRSDTDWERIDKLKDIVRLFSMQIGLGFFSICRRFMIHISDRDTIEFVMQNM